jgi:large subunit ribosomal protein L15
MSFGLNNLRPNPGSTRGKIRVGRGIGSGKGKTCGRGGKGQTARSGVAINGFEGGQTPIHRRLPKRGFNNFSRKEYDTVNLSDIQTAIDEKKLTSPVTVESLKAAGLVKDRLDGVKLLGDGKLTAKVEISVNKASASAVKAVEKAGGKVSLVVAAVAAPKAEGEAKAKKAPKAKAEKKTKK